jgi:hypothetical protein
MKKAIWKIVFAPESRAIEMMPKGAVILDAQNQGGSLAIWVMVDPGDDRVTREFRILMTGEEFEGDPGVYVATVQFGAIVVHVFDRGES